MVCRGDMRRPGRRGFTLTELLVVIGITTVLLFLLFIPLSRALDLSARAEGRVSAQDTVRGAVRRITRDLQNAMVVYPPREIQIWGFDQWVNPKNRPAPAPGAVPEPYLVRNGLIAFRPPKYRHFCRASELDPALQDHYINPDELGLITPGQVVDQEDDVSVDTCPRPTHQGAPVELQPKQPLEPSDLVTVYFVGLKDPDVRTPANQPLYQNTLLFRNTSSGFLNTYILWRVEFDPRNPIYSNFANPDFFYDRRTVTDPVSGLTRSYSQWWRLAATRMITGESVDLVRWVETASTAKYIPHTMVSFNPTPFEEDVAQPNRTAGQFTLFGSSLPSDLPPGEYETQYGNWLLGVPLPMGFAANGRAPIPDAIRMSNNVQTGMVLGPRIQVFGYSVPKVTTQPSTLGVVFDSAATTLRNRLVAFDPITGHVSLGIPRARTRQLDSAEQSENTRLGGQIGALYLDYFSATVDLGTFTAALADNPFTSPVEGDQEADTTTNIPTALGSARVRQLQLEAASTNREDFSAVVPGSDSVLLADTSGTTLQTQQMRRAGWTGLGRYDHPIAQSDLAVDEYSIDYQTGVITLSDRRPGIWTTVGPAAAGLSQHLLVKYDFQTNRASDLVKVSYSTATLASVNLGVVQYTQRRGEALPFEVSERVAIKNLSR